MDRIQVVRFVEEELNDVVLALGVVEEDKETPVDQPAPLLETQQMSCVDLARKEMENIAR